MKIFNLAWKNANGNAYRSWVVLICAALMAGLTVSATIVIGGAQNSLNLALERLGADMIVVPAGAELEMENAFLMGVPVAAWMPRGYVEQTAAIPGVKATSPQFFLATLRGASCCSVPEMFLIAYDPETDFTLRPWLDKNLEDGLQLNEAVGGAFVYVPDDPGYILVYGQKIDLRGNLEPTGTGLDQSMFFTFETAYNIAQLSPSQAEQELDIPYDSISAVMVKLDPGADSQFVANKIKQTLPGITAVESSNLFHSQRVQILGLLQNVLALLGVAWLLSLVLIGLVFAMTVNDRRQQIGVLRALGFRRQSVLQSLVLEGAILSLTGSGAGISLFTFAVFLFQNLIIQMMGVPFLFPSLGSLSLLAIGALTLSLVSVSIGIFIPAAYVSLMDPAHAMRK